MRYETPAPAPVSVITQKRTGTSPNFVFASTLNYAYADQIDTVRVIKQQHLALLPRKLLGCLGVRACKREPLRGRNACVAKPPLQPPRQLKKL